MKEVEAVLVRSDGVLERGGTELLEAWRTDPHSHIWVNLHSVPEQEEVPVFAAFGTHTLAIRDARRERHPPKVELFENHIFVLISELGGHETDLDFTAVQLAMFAGPRFLLTRHDAPSVSVDYWLKSNELPSVLLSGGIHLAFEIANTAARRFVDMLLDFEPRLSELEDEIQDRPDDGTMAELTQYRTRLRKLRRLFKYEAQIFETLRSVKTDYFNAGSHEYRHQLLDVYEKYERLLSLSTLYYELAGDLVDGYISLTNHALNNTMRLLTAITAIFVPLSFVAGLYGMNFHYMPELSWRWGYFVVLGCMAMVIVVLLVLFRKKRWL